MAGSPYVIDYQGRFQLPVPPGAVWSAIGQIDRFESWWGWLRALTVEAPSGPMLQPGTVLRGVVVPPLPYRMRVQVNLVNCVPGRRIEAAVQGDLEGRAQLVLEDHGDGTTATAAWTIEMKQRPMRLAALVAAPLLRWGHDRVVDATVMSFRSRLTELASESPG